MTAPSRWRCPECGRDFGRRNQSHTCIPARSLEEWLAERSPTDRATVEALLDHLRSLGPIVVDAVQIGLLIKRNSTFAEVRPRRAGLRLILLVSRALDDPRLVRSLRLSANRWAYELDLHDPGEVDTQVRDWLTEAYESSRT